MHYQNITRSLAFLREVCDRRLQSFYNKENATAFSYPELKIESVDAPLNHFLANHQLNIEEYVILMLALAPHIQPNLLDNIIQLYLPGGGDFPEFGGAKVNNHRGTIPTGETALFILAGNELTKRMQASLYFSPGHFFAKENILTLEPVKDGEPRFSGKIVLQQEYVDLLTIGTIAKPV